MLLEIDTVDGPLSRLVETVRRAHDELTAFTSRNGPNGEVDVLADWLYLHWYSCPATAWDSAPIPPGRTNLLPALRASLAATGRWETGWVALQVMRDNACLTGRGQLTRIVASGDYANVARPGVPVAPGDELAVLDRLDWVDEPTGFWSARSLEAEPPHPLRRVYWSVGWDSIGAVLRRLVPVLDAADRPWSLKCPTQAAEFTRIDSLVVYVARADWPVFEAPVRALALRLSAYLRHSVPPLTLPIASGVALADSPARTQSFGQSRCAALAEGARALLARPDIEMPEAIALLKNCLRARAINPDRPWVCD
jgi:HopA1 effector protein family